MKKVGGTHQKNRGDISRLRRDRHRRKLSRYLGEMDDEGFCQLVWAVQLLQDGDVERAKNYMTFPEKAVGARLGDPFFIAGWDLETLVNERLIAPSVSLGARRSLLCRSLETIGMVRNHLLQLENAETGLFLQHLDVMLEMPRIIHHQFEWQRGVLNGPQFYRPAFLYGGPEAADYFRQSTGLTVPEIMLFGLTLRAIFYLDPVWDGRTGLAEIEFDRKMAVAAMRMISVPLAEGRRMARSKRGRGHPAYQWSLLRQSPVLLFGERGERPRAPVPDLVVTRVTTGLFYDIASGPGGVRNETADRFEMYVRDLTAAALPGMVAAKGLDHGRKGRTVGGPDVVLERAGRLAAVIECKSRKMSVDARFSVTPETDKGMDELAKGVVQLWRYFAHHRQGLAAGTPPDSRTAAVLITLDPWMLMSRRRAAAVLAAANSMADGIDPPIEALDRRPIIFASIEDWEFAVANGDAQGFERTLAAAVLPEYEGWMLWSVRDQVAPGEEQPYALAERLGDALPWWAALQAG